MEKLNAKKIALVYDWIDSWGGVERILLIIKELFPHADFYSSYADFQKANWAKNFTIKTSFLDRLPFRIKTNRIFSLPLYPYVFESFDFTDYDLVISVSSSFAKGIITRPETIHICYLLTPTRFLWVSKNDYLGKICGNVLEKYIYHLKKWDIIAAQRPDYYISVSNTVASRCLKYYQRDSEIIYPPFDISYWNKINAAKEKTKKLEKILNMLKNDKYFLIVSRLEPYKKIDLVIEAFRKKKNLKLIIVGQGSQEMKLKASAGQNIFFLHSLSDKELAYIYNNAEATILAQEEDFGYVSLEAQFFKCPVIAFKKGGSTETVLENKTGVFFGKQDTFSLIDAVERYEKISYNIKTYMDSNSLLHLSKFERNIFEQKLIYSIQDKFK